MALRAIFYVTLAGLTFVSLLCGAIFLLRLGAQ